MPPTLPRGGLHLGLTVAFTAGCGLVVAAPWLAQQGSWIAPILYAAFDPVCHQLAERSFHLGSHPLAVCHRCSGLYLGFTLGIAAWPLLPRAAAILLLRPRWILAFAAPLAIDALIVANTAASRFATGVVAAFPVALLVLAAAAQLGDRPGPPGRTAQNGELAARGDHDFRHRLPAPHRPDPEPIPIRRAGAPGGSS